MSNNTDKEYQFHFIPNTHWDREWLYNFQETRMFLVEFMDKLLDIFERFPQYKTYLLESQILEERGQVEVAQAVLKKGLTYNPSNPMLMKRMERKR